MGVTYENLRADYDGSVFVNCRSIFRPVSLMTDFNKHEPLKLTELAEILEFVESSALSKRVYYDSTVPKSTMEKTSNSIQTIVSQVGTSAITVVPRAPKDETEFLWLALGAVERASHQLRELADDVSGQLVSQSLSQEEGGLGSGEIKPIIRIIKQRAEMRSESQMDQFSLEVLGMKHMLGRKLLAGLVHSHNSDTFDAIYLPIINIQATRQGELISAMVNTFRAHLLSGWAKEFNSAYQVPDFVSWSIAERYGRLAWDLVVKSDLPELQASLEIGERQARVQQIPPLGLWTLMQTRPSDGPFGILTTANDLIKSRSGLSFRKIMWDASLRDEQAQDEFKKLVSKAVAAYYGPKSKKSLGQWQSLIFPSLKIVKDVVQLIFSGGTANWLRFNFFGIPEIYNEIRVHTGERGFINFYRELAIGVSKTNRKSIERHVKEVLRRDIDWAN